MSILSLVVPQEHRPCEKNFCSGPRWHICTKLKGLCRRQISQQLLARGWGKVATHWKGFVSRRGRKTTDENALRGQLPRSTAVTSSSPQD